MKNQFIRQVMHNKVHLTIIMCSFMLFCYAPTKAQNVENLKGMFAKKNLLKVNGGIAANSVFTGGSGEVGRNPFTWMLNGNVNFNLLGQINVPLSFNLTNIGGGFAYPTLPSRISLTPTYKNITGYIGDVNMTFSPYTLNGHQFRGLGADVKISEHWNVSAMTGRLQRAVELDSSNQIVPAAYKRMGYGAKVMYEKELYKVGVIVFGAKDKVSSLVNKPDSLNIFPEQNLSVSYIGSLRPIKGMELSVEYANSILGRDVRDTAKSGDSKGLSSRNSTSVYNAVKAQLNYLVKKSTIGIGYERVDPGYRTLGAYFFNNDLENITVNFSQPILRDKGSVAVNIGLQKDDLDNSKSGKNRRTVSALNLAYSPTARLSTAFSYSNFQTYMFIKPQFQLLNQFTQINNFDTLNFTQISQNANLNLNYGISQTKDVNQIINFNLSFQDAVDKQGGIVRKGNASAFYNANTSYSLVLVPKNISITAAYNFSYNTIGLNDFTTYGPTLGLSSKIIKKQVTTGIIGSYNASKSNASSKDVSKVMIFRYNAAYIFKKKHNVNFSLMNQFRQIAGRPNDTNMMGILGYNFSF